MDTVLWLCPSLPTETLKWLSSLPILMQKSFWWWQCSDRYIISLSPHLHTPFPPPPFSPSLISLVVSVDVKRHVYFRSIFLLLWSPCGRTWWRHADRARGGPDGILLQTTSIAGSCHRQVWSQCRRHDDTCTGHLPAFGVRITRSVELVNSTPRHHKACGLALVALALSLPTTLHLFKSSQARSSQQNTLIIP